MDFLDFSRRQIHVLNRPLKFEPLKPLESNKEGETLGQSSRIKIVKDKRYLDYRRFPIAIKDSTNRYLYVIDPVDISLKHWRSLLYAIEWFDEENFILLFSRKSKSFDVSNIFRPVLYFSSSKLHYLYLPGNSITIVDPDRFQAISYSQKSSFKRLFLERFERYRKNLIKYIKLQFYDFKTAKETEYATSLEILSKILKKEDERGTRLFSIFNGEDPEFKAEDSVILERNKSRLLISAAVKAKSKNEIKVDLKSRSVLLTNNTSSKKISRGSEILVFKDRYLDVKRLKSRTILTDESRSVVLPEMSVGEFINFRNFGVSILKSQILIKNDLSIQKLSKKLQKAQKTIISSDGEKILLFSKNKKVYFIENTIITDLTDFLSSDFLKSLKSCTDSPELLQPTALSKKKLIASSKQFISVIDLDKKREYLTKIPSFSDLNFSACLLKDDVLFIVNYSLDKYGEAPGFDLSWSFVTLSDELANDRNYRLLILDTKTNQVFEERINTDILVDMLEEKYSESKSSKFSERFSNEILPKIRRKMLIRKKRRL